MGRRGGLAVPSQKSGKMAEFLVKLTDLKVKIINIYRSL